MDIDIVVRAIPVLSSMILAWISLLILYLIAKKFLHGPVTKMIDDRKEKIKTNIDEASNLKEEALALKAEYESNIENAKKEAQGILESARQRGEELRQGIVEEARVEADAILTRAKKDIDMERDTALQGVQKEAVNMAVLIASKLIEEKISIENQENLINKFVEEVGTSKWQS